MKSRLDAGPAPVPGKKRPTVSKKTTRVAARWGSGNVFADLGLPHPRQELLRAYLALQIYKTVNDRGLTHAKASEVLGIKQATFRR